MRINKMMTIERVNIDISGYDDYANILKGGVPHYFLLFDGKKQFTANIDEVSKLAWNGQLEGYHYGCYYALEGNIKLISKFIRYYGKRNLKMPRPVDFVTESKHRFFSDTKNQSHSIETIVLDMFVLGRKYTGVSLEGDRLVVTVHLYNLQYVNYYYKLDLGNLAKLKMMR